jgi:hypothetical protein
MPVVCSAMAVPPSYESEFLELDHHAVHGRQCHDEESLHVGFGGTPVIHNAVGVNEGEILALKVC